MASPLKIALLSRWYWEENRRIGTAEGGTIQQLAEAVAAQGHEVVVLSQSPQVTQREKSRIGSLEVWLTPRKKRRGGWTALRDKVAKVFFGHRKVYSDALDLRDFLQERGPFDFLWAQCEEPDGLVAAIAQKMGVKLPPTLTQVFALRYRFKKSRPVFTEKKALRLAFRQADLILANSQLVQDSLQNYGPFEAKSVVFLHNLTRAFLGALAEKETSPEKNRILFLGALNEKKGVLDFLAALPLLKLAEASFVILGGFTEKNPAFRAKWEHQLKITQDELEKKNQRLEVLGKLPAEEVRREIQRAQLVVAPSIYEEFSRVVIEALALGRPVVTTSTTGAAPLVVQHQAGRVVSAGDPAALAQAIEAAVQPEAPDLANARHAAPQLREQFSPESFAREFIAHAEEVLKKNQVKGTSRPN